jgi:ubiquinone/menaquinone biosynthesis C-methylase UbiE
MDAAINNTQYWETLPAKDIIGRNAVPGDELLKILPAQAAILDLGCGTGEMAEYLSGQGYKVTGIDINRDAITQNKSKPTKVNYVLGDIAKLLPFADGSFEAITTSFTILNIMPPIREKLVSELGRILKPGGLVWVNEPLVSQDYAARYELSRPFVDNDHDFVVFKEGTAASSIQTPEQMSQAARAGKVARVTHHFTMEELEELFNDYEIIYSHQTQTASPNSKSAMEMAIIVFQLK